MAEAKPSFALDLSNEGITLWQRAGSGTWDALGRIPLDAPNIPAQIKLLRTKAGVKHAAPLKAIVRIPRTEVLFSRLKLGVFEGDAAEKQARKLIDDLTPYNLDEILYDLEEKGAGNMAPVAVVARSTLEEAEAFAAQNGFEALYFSTEFEPREFPREPRFYLKKPKKPVLPMLSKVAAMVAVGLSIGYFGYANFLAPQQPETPLTSPQTAQIAEPAAITSPSIAKVEPAKPAAEPEPVVPGNEAPDFSAPQTATLIAPETSTYENFSFGDVGRTNLARITRLARPLYQKGEPRPPTPTNPPRHKTDALALADALRDLPEVGITDETLASLQADMALPEVAQGSNGTAFDLAAFVPPDIDFTKVYNSTLTAPPAAYQPPPVKSAVNPDPPPPPPAYTTAAPGTLTPTPQGTPGPENIRIYAGRPPVLPRTRPEVVGPVDPLGRFKPRLRPQGLVSEELLASLVPTDGTAPAPPPAPALSADTAPVNAPDDTPAQLAAIPAAPQTPTQTDAAFAAPENTPRPKTLLELADPALAGFKPRLRPSRLNARVTEEPQGLPALADPTLAGKKARRRPATLAPKTAALPQGLLAQADPALAKFRAKRRPDNLRIIKPEAEPAPPPAGATRLAVALSLIPKQRPENLGPGLAVKTEGNTKATAKTPKSAVGTSKPSPGPTVVAVSKAATQKAHFNKRKMNLVGVFGTPNARRALIRMPSGRYVKVKTGDRISGWQVSAIGESSLRIRKGTKNQVLRMP
jgi:type IV pilus biogenesis protein PilP